MRSLQFSKKQNSDFRNKDSGRECLGADKKRHLRYEYGQVVRNMNKQKYYRGRQNIIVKHSTNVSTLIVFLALGWAVTLKGFPIYHLKKFRYSALAREQVPHMHSRMAGAPR